MKKFVMFVLMSAVSMSLVPSANAGIARLGAKATAKTAKFGAKATKGAAKVAWKVIY